LEIAENSSPNFLFLKICLLEYCESEATFGVGTYGDVIFEDVNGDEI
jgi:hypothetical protein